MNPTKMLFGSIGLWQVHLDEFNYGTIDHLLASMCEIHRHIVANDGLHLTKAPVGAVRMRDEIAEAEIEHGPSAGLA